MSNASENTSNPFAVYSSTLPPVSQYAGGIYRRCKLLVVHKSAEFPARVLSFEKRFLNGPTPDSD